MLQMKTQHQKLSCQQVCIYLPIVQTSKLRILARDLNMAQPNSLTDMTNSLGANNNSWSKSPSTLPPKINLLCSLITKSMSIGPNSIPTLKITPLSLKMNGSIEIPSQIDSPISLGWNIRKTSIKVTVSGVNSFNLIWICRKYETDKCVAVPETYER